MKLLTSTFNEISIFYQSFSKPLKVRLYKELILPIAAYAAETWNIKSEDNRKLEAFEMRCLRAISGVKLRDRGSENGLAK